MGDLTGRRVLVTGGSSGIGAAMVEVFSESGAGVGFLGRDAERVGSVAATTGALGIVADVADLAGVAAAVDQVADHLGGLDAIVNNAGVMLHSRISTGSFTDWATMIEINVVGVLAVTNAALPHLRQAECADIVNVGSAAAKGVSNSDFAVYAATKAAVARITEGTRAELAGSNIRVALVTPGYINTPGLGPGIRDEALRERTVATRLRMGLPPRLLAEQIVHVLAAPPAVTISEIVIAGTAV
jgi:NADP-dependent 3-hydroxy acid dehydrogenase YdfG